MRIPLARLSIGLTALSMAMVASAARAGNYVFTNFDVPGDTNGTTVNGINNNGQAVGFSTDASNNFTNFIRNADGSFTTLTFNGSAAAMANGINSSGQVVGMTGNDAFLLDSNSSTPTILPAVNGGATSESAFGINNSGTIVGQYTDANGDMHGFVYANGHFTILNPVPGDMQVFAQGINNNGLVVGFYDIDGVTDHGFLYNTSNNQYTLIADPNVGPGLVLTQFLGINDEGVAVGYYQTADGSQIGFLYNIATQQYTFLNDPNAPTSGVSMTQITGINDSGEISGFYVDANGVSHGFVAISSVPEPGSLALLGLGMTLAAGDSVRRARGRRRDA